LFRSGATPPCARNLNPDARYLLIIVVGEHQGGHPELAQFCDEMLGKLLDYDAQHNSTLVETLSEYFTQRGNLSRTAEALYIHRNTLQYRMERIGEITGLDLDNPETRLAMQLALKAFKILPNAMINTARSL